MFKFDLVIDSQSPSLADDIAVLLRQHGVAMESFGVGTSDPFDELISEIRKKKRYLGVKDGVLIAWARVVCVVVQSPDEGLYLFANKQLIKATGALVGIRDGIFPAKKTPPEIPDHDALVLCLRQELGLNPDDYDILEGPEDVEEKLQYPSFPQLPKIYFQQFWRVRLKHHAFRPDGYMEVSGQGNETNFVWGARTPQRAKSLG